VIHVEVSESVRSMIYRENLVVNVIRFWGKDITGGFYPFSDAFSVLSTDQVRNARTGFAS
jgi:hypothetical protein